MADSFSSYKIPKLKGSSNYDIWNIRISQILTEKGLDIVTNLADLGNDLELIQQNKKAVAIVKLSLEDGPLLQTQYITSAYILGQTLKNLYMSRGFSSDYILSKELINNTLSNNKNNLEFYVNNFRRILNQLKSKDIVLPDKFIVALLLNNLSKDYDNIVAIITQNIRLEQQSNITIDDIINQLLDENRRLKSNYKSNNNTTYVNYRSYNKNNDSDVEMAMPTKAKKTKKSKANSINNTTNSSYNNTKNNKTCNYCKLKGHLESTCYKKYPEKRPKQVSSTKVETVLTSTISNSNNKSYNNNIIDFVLDSGATIHTCYIKELFASIKPTNTNIKWGNTNKIIKASGIGNIELKFTSTNKLVKLNNVLYIPELGVNLLSLSLITNKGYSLSFNKDKCYIYLPNKNILTEGSYKEGVSVFSTISTKSSNISNLKRVLTSISNTIEEDIEDSDNSLNLVDSTQEEDIIIENTIELEDNTSSNKDSSITINSNNNKEELVLNNNSIDLIHKRLGHISLKTIKHLVKNTKGCSFINLEDISSATTSLDNCTVCIQAKLTKNRSLEPSTKVEAYLDLLYIDIGGPIRPKTFRGFKYYITFRDAKTKYLIVKLLKSRKDLVLIIKDTISELELEAKDNNTLEDNSNSSSNSNYNKELEVISNFNNNKVKALQLDNEFKSKELDTYLLNKGIKRRYSSPYTPEQNGAAEIINRVLLNKVRALLINSNLPKNLWGEAILTATYLYNRTPSSSIGFKTPYELKYKELPDLDNIRIFGSLVYYKEPSNFIKKLDSRATPYYLIGFTSSNIYKLYNPSTNKVINARDCKIIEGYYYSPNRNNNIKEIFTNIEDLKETSNKVIEFNSEDELNSIIPSSSKVIKKTTRPIRSRIIDNSSEDELANNTTITNSILSTIEFNNSKKDWKSLYNKAILFNIFNTIKNSNLEEPKTYKEALNRIDKDLYIKAMQTEVDDLLKSNTWTLVLNSNYSIIKGRWVLNKKYNLDNTIKKYKARWVAKGFLQKYEINYKETFASTSKPSIIRLLLSITAYLDWEIYTWDIKQAFPNADIDNNNIYIQLPIGFEEYIIKKALESREIKDITLIKELNKATTNKDYNNIICRLNKALYGLKQASRQWQLFLTKILESLGFTSLKIDNSVFVHKEKPIILATHVDDILVFAQNIDLVNNLYKDLSRTSKLEITNLGEIKEFLGVEIIRDRPNKSLIITQRSFISKILEKYNKLQNKPKNLPLPIGIKLSKNLESLDNNTIISDYQKEIGSLIYLTIFTRPDLVYSVNYLARFMSNPTLEHYNYLNNVFSYLLKTKDLGLDLTLESIEQSTNNLTTNTRDISNSINLLGISDADWGGDIDSRKSTTGNIFVLNNNKDNYSNNSNIAISWISKLQKTVAISSAEAEYMSLKEATKESLYLQNFIKELFNNKALKSYNLFNNLNTIKTDSLSAIELAKNPIYHARTKHVDITYHFVRENLLSNNTSLVYENTSTILADNLTKVTSIPKFKDFISRINLVKTRTSTLVD